MLVMNNLNIFISIFLTVVFYFIFLRIYGIKRHILLHPNIAASIVLVVLLYVFDVSFEVYNTGGEYITSFLGVCIVVLAVPMYQQLRVLKDNLWLIVCSSLVSIYCSFFSMLLFAKVFSVPGTFVFSLIPKSITSPMAIEASRITGGSESVAILGVLVSGILGAIIGRFILDLIRVKDPIVRGCAFGMSSHVMGTTQALEEGEVTGSFSAVSIPVTGVLTIINLPLFAKIVSYFLL